MSFTALSWSGGKDSALTLLELREQGIEPQALITTLTDGFDRISMHGVRRQLLHAQAAAAGVPLVEVVIPQSCDNETYEARFADAFRCPPLDEVESVAFGDLFLQDIREYREERLIVDPCGENGEFHTFVFGGPIFSQPILCETGEVVERNGFVFCDLVVG